MSNIRGSSAGGSNVSSPLNSRRGSSVTNADDDSEEQRRMAAEVGAARKRVEDIRRKRASRPERKMVRKKSSNKDLGKKAELGHSRHKQSRRADSRRTKETTRRNPTEESRTKVRGGSWCPFAARSLSHSKSLTLTGLADGIGGGKELCVGHSGRRCAL